MKFRGLTQPLTSSLLAAETPLQGYKPQCVLQWLKIELYVPVHAGVGYAYQSLHSHSHWPHRDCVHQPAGEPFSRPKFYHKPKTTLPISLSSSPQVVTGSHDCTIRLWDLAACWQDESCSHKEECSSLGPPSLRVSPPWLGSFCGAGV